MLFLMQFSSLTFPRDSGDGYWDSHGEWVEGTPETIEATGNLQPFRQGKEQTILPDGRTSDDAYIFYTDTRLQTASQFTDTVADETIIDDLEYYVMSVEDWHKQGTLLPQHYKCILVRKDHPTNGGL